MTSQSDFFEVLITANQYTKLKQQNESLTAANTELRNDIKLLQNKVNHLTNHIQGEDLAAKYKQLSVHALIIGNKLIELEEELALKQEHQIQLLRQSGSLYRDAIHKTSSQDDLKLLVKISELEEEVLNIKKEREGKINQLTQKQTLLREQIKQKQNSLDQLKSQIVTREERWNQKLQNCEKEMLLKDQNYSQQVKIAQSQIVCLKQELNQLRLASEQQHIQNNRVMAQYKHKQQQLAIKNKQILEKERRVLQSFQNIRRNEQQLKSRECQLERALKEQHSNQEEMNKRILQTENKDKYLSQLEEQLKIKMDKIQSLEKHNQNQKAQLDKQKRTQQQNYQNQIRSLKAFDNFDQYEDKIKNLKQTIEQMQNNTKGLMLQLQQKQKLASATQQILYNLSQNQRIQEIIRSNFQSMIILYRARLQKNNDQEIKQKLLLKKNELIRSLNKIFQELLQKK